MGFHGFLTVMAVHFLLKDYRDYPRKTNFPSQATYLAKHGASIKTSHLSTTIPIHFVSKIPKNLLLFDAEPTLASSPHSRSYFSWFPFR